MSIWLVTLIVALGAALPVHAQAQDSLLPTLVRPTTQPLPLFPSRELSRGHEGWVLLDLTVSDEGVVGDARIVDSSGSKAFDAAALDAIQKWRFEPVPGKTKSRVLVNFEFHRTYPQLSRRFLSRYKTAHQAIDDGDLEKAQDLVEKMRHDSKLTVFELAYTNIAAGHVAAERGKRAEQLKYFRRAMLNEGRWLENRTYRYLLYAAVVLEIQEEDFASALRDYALLTETSTGREIAADLDEPIRLIRSIVDGDNSITPPFMVADMEVSVKRERPNQRGNSLGRRDYSGSSIAEREYQRMQKPQKQN
jgi:TonB family protein